jgi:transcription elongation factor Elf1
VKTCRACNQLKALDCFKQVKAEPPRYDATCKVCRSTQASKRQVTTEREV